MSEAPSKRLYRSRSVASSSSSGSERRVCGGMTAYFGIGPVIPRLIWVVFALAAGSGILAYLICWLVIPEEPQAAKAQ